MRQLPCSSCGKEESAATMFNVDGAIVCEPCGDRLVTEAHEAKRKPRVLRVQDPTICARCKKDFGNTELPLVAHAHFCHDCAELIYAFPFPAWLKASFVGLLLLLAFSLYRGGPYFAAGRNLVRARRAMERHDYRAAAPHFAGLLALKPTDQNVILDAAKAHLMIGDVATAGAFLDLRSEYEDNPQFRDVNTFWDRAVRAYTKADSAGKLANANYTPQANRMMAEAAREYPESPGLAAGALIFQGGEAFERKDYDTFLATARQALALIPDEPRLIGTVASALAAKYATTGDPAFRDESEQYLTRAQAAADTPEEQASYDEYAERIRHRLATRVIIDKDEYDRRFRKTP